MLRCYSCIKPFIDTVHLPTQLGLGHYASSHLTNFYCGVWTYGDNHTTFLFSYSLWKIISIIKWNSLLLNWFLKTYIQCLFVVSISAFKIYMILSVKVIILPFAFHLNTYFEPSKSSTVECKKDYKIIFINIRESMEVVIQNLKNFNRGDRYRFL